MTEAPTERTPLMVRCGDCDHRWPAAYLPMEAGRAARVLARAHCPMCGADPKRIFTAADEMRWPPARAEVPAHG